MSQDAPKYNDLNNRYPGDFRSGEIILYGYNGTQFDIYKPAYVNHPCTIWARQTHENYRWLLLHFITLCEEYHFRYGKIHLSWTKLWDGLKTFPMMIDEGELTPFAQAMPEQYKSDNHIWSYRKYMIGEKHYAKWEKGRSKPNWWH